MAMATAVAEPSAAGRRSLAQVETRWRRGLHHQQGPGAGGGGSRDVGEQDTGPDGSKDGEKIRGV